MNKYWQKTIGGILLLLLSQCSSYISDSEEREAILQRNQEIIAEKKGDFYYGRRYFIPHTRFWGYLRSPGEKWSQAKLVIMDETKISVPDRLPENRAQHKIPGQDHGYDHNYEYRIYGQYTGKNAYEPNTDLILPIFRITRYELVSSQPGFLFTPKEKYSENEVSLYPTLIPPEQR